MGYPTNVMPGLGFIRNYFEPGDEERLAFDFDFDFIGLQYYFRVVARFSLFPPVLFPNEGSPIKRGSSVKSMGLDIYFKGLKYLLTTTQNTKA
jgi:beta-glucosidase